MEQIKWCIKQKKGIRLIDINLDISNSYIKKSNESLEMISLANKSWKVICSYYACYDILYALFMKCGIKSEIHECSMSLMDLFDKFTSEDKLFLKNLKENRVYAQYYVNKFYDEYNTDEIKQFVLKVKELILTIKEEEILIIRDKIQKIIDQR